MGRLLFSVWTRNRAVAGYILEESSCYSSIKGTMNGGQKHKIQTHLKPNGRELSWVFQVGCNYRTLDSWLQILGSKFKFWYTETSTNISCKLIITALDISKYEGKVVMMAFGCLWLKYDKKIMDQFAGDGSHPLVYLLTKATCMNDKDEVVRQHLWYFFLSWNIERMFWKKVWWDLHFSNMSKTAGEGATTWFMFKIL